MFNLIIATLVQVNLEVWQKFTFLKIDHNSAFLYPIAKII